MKNYYELLEVSQNASSEVIERSYKVLVKKFHPDLHPNEDKKMMEQKMMEINEAYEVLKDEDKKYEYDQKLAWEKEEEQAKNQSYSNPYTSSYNSYGQNSNRQRYSSVNTDPYSQSANTKKTYQTSTQQSNQQRPLTKEEEKQQKKEYKRMRMEMQNKAQYEYEEQYRRMGYNVKHTLTWMEKKRLALIVLSIIAFCLIIWFFPPTKKLLVNLYNENSIIKFIGDIINAFIQSIKQTFSQTKTIT